MYGFLWSLIPGPRWFKIIVVLALLAAVFYVLMQFIFPWVSERMPYSDVAV